MKREIIRICIRALSVIMMVFSVGMLIYIATENNRGKAVFTDEVELVRPVREDPEAFDLKALQEVVPEAVGWLTVDGSGIDFPVMQDAAIREEYLRTGRVENPSLIPYQERIYHYLFYDYLGRRAETGSITADIRTDVDGGYVLIYGHNVGREGVMFSDLEAYRDPAYCAEHRGGVLYTATGAHELELIAVGSVDGYTREVFDQMQDAALALRFVMTNPFWRSPQAGFLCMDADGEQLVFLSTCAVAEHPEDPERLEVVFRVKK